MQYKLPVILALSMLTIGSVSTEAQTVSTFDDVTLPGADTSFLETITATGTHTFESGNTRFYGTVAPGWGGGYYFAQFNYSNRTDTITPDYNNQWSAITGKGVNNSANYGITYAEVDFTNYNISPENGPKLTGSAANSKVAGMYVTNTTYAYHYIKDNYVAGDSFALVIRGYNNNVKSNDSIIVDLAKYGSDTLILKKWQWVNLLPLGNVDSLTFQVMSSDDYTPYYFAIDNLTTMDGVCPVAQNITAVSINENSATINWTNSVAGFTADYQVAVDQSATLAPTATATTVSNSTYNATGLSNNTVYYAHVRSSCDDGGFSAWDTATFKTLQGTGIFQTNPNDIRLSISPNPATDFVTLHTGIAVNAIIYSIEGRELLQVNQAKTINISSLPRGVYLLKVTDAAGTGKQTTLRFSKN